MGQMQITNGGVGRTHQTFISSFFFFICYFVSANEKCNRFTFTSGSLWLSQNGTLHSLTGGLAKLYFVSLPHLFCHKDMYPHLYETGLTRDILRGRQKKKREPNKKKIVANLCRSGDQAV